jgi:hypothetical protein
LVLSWTVDGKVKKVKLFILWNSTL